ncbi:aminotransferase class IV family protein [Hoeflea sp.]|uniref:aminotransferase class IV family protein n=1 Tax=Hoeflea sp. TaxID=1940281 RepID=UPI003B021C9E
MRDAHKPGLIETMRQRADGTIDRLPLHLNRLRHSAEILKIPHDPVETAAAIEGLKADGGDRRLRLELSPHGEIRMEVFPCPAMDMRRPWQIAFAATHLRSTDPLLPHKTTFRNVYTRARDEFPSDRIDEVVLCNEKDELCEGTITSVFLQVRESETLLTPALSSGLLRGVLRQELLDTGKAREAVLTRSDLQAASRIYVGNSLRGLIPAVLVQ